VRLVFDINVAGLARWARRRLELLGVKVEVTPYRADFQIEKYVRLLAREERVFLVTTDEDFLMLEREGLAIVLPQPLKYEKALTAIIRRVFGGR